MRAVVQRVSKASVEVDQSVVGEIELGLMVLLGVEKGDDHRDLNYLAEKTAGLRIFPDENGLMNRSLLDVGGGALVVSQFTLLGDVRKGKRPSFTDAAPPNEANRLYEAYCQRLTELGVVRVEQGVFQADMKVGLINDGPVTILLDSNKLF